MRITLRTVLAGLAVALAVAAVLLFGISLSHGLVGALAALDKGSEEHFIPADLSELARLLRQGSALLLCAAAVAGLAIRLRWFEGGVSWRPVNNALWTLVCSGLLLWYLSRLSYDAPWYKLGVLIEGSETLEVFSRRLLFIWPARWLHQAAPGLSDLRVYWMVQAPIILVTMILVRKWSELFIEESRAFLGQVLTVFLLAPMFSYYTFYDVAIVAFYTAGLLALWKRAYIWFALAVGVGALNHENTLLLVFVAAVCLWGESRKTLTRALGFSLAAWLMARVVMTLAVPMRATVHFRILTNLWELLHAPGAMAFTAMAWLPLVLLTILGWKAAPRMVRQMAVLAIPLLAVTYLFGKFREARQVDAYIPVAVAFGLCGLQRLNLSSDNLRAN